MGLNYKNLNLISLNKIKTVKRFVKKINTKLCKKMLIRYKQTIKFNNLKIRHKIIE